MRPTARLADADKNLARHRLWVRARRGTADKNLGPLPLVTKNFTSTSSAYDHEFGVMPPATKSLRCRLGQRAHRDASNKNLDCRHPLWPACNRELAVTPYATKSPSCRRELFRLWLWDWGFTRIPITIFLHDKSKSADSFCKLLRP
jgi:hypothetical protein